MKNFSSLMWYSFHVIFILSIFLNKIVVGDISSARDDCSIVSEGKTTLSNFLKFVENERGLNFVEEQRVILKMLYDDFLAGLETKEKPLMLAMSGPAGAGKTTYRKNNLSQSEWHIHDLDEVMAKLPQYKIDVKDIGPKLAFEKWLLFARNMSQLLLKFAIKSKMNVIYDRTCGHISSFDDLTFAKQQGYYIKLIGLFIKFDTARQRVLNRELQGGHGMPENILIESCEAFSALWPYYLAIVDEAFLYDASQNPFTLIFSSKTNDGNSDLYKEFLQCGGSYKEFFAKNYRFLHTHAE